ncbi:Rossmann-like and DUF2520 domain-containing protein [Rapidithrix thailandica]|uniref:Rossmann-like and DUF2520 domain-containing protein n=1 Tax=Rapidithrix thailandica TaxID=413964 RepID=A0AAW9S694_9BACT
MQPIKIAFIGAGNVAWHLAPALQAKGAQVVEVVNRSPEKALSLVEKLSSAKVKADLDFRNSEADWVFITAPDAQIEPLASQIQLAPRQVLLHTSGSQPLGILQNAHLQSGVFYPLQTFSKEKCIDFRKVHFYIEGSNTPVERKLLSLARKLSPLVSTATSQQRLGLHMAAVFACNFPNHLLLMAQSVMEQYELDFTALKPLVEEMVEKAFALGPEKAQTGPAIRKDTNTIQRHEALLESSAMQSVYQLLSQSIQKKGKD